MGLIPLLVGFLLLLQGAGEPAPDVHAQYEAERVKVGRDADAHVRLAEWCAEHGLDAERAKHLRMALIIAPDHEMARTLLGMPASEAQVEKEAAKAELLAEYNAKKAKTPSTANAHWTLALWCERVGLKAEATAHFAEVVRLDPKREAAWKHLGFKRHNGRWMTEEDIREADAQKKADRDWSKRLAAIHKHIHRGPEKEKAEAELAAIDDPRAVPSIFREFARGKASDQKIAVQVMGQTRTPASSRVLASLAVFSSNPEVRRLATETLQTRDPLEYLGGLLALISDPLKFEVRPVNGPGSVGVLFVEGKEFNVRRFYAPPAMNIGLQPGDIVTYDQFGMPVINRPNGVVDNFTPYTTGAPSGAVSGLASVLGQAGVPNASALAAGALGPAPGAGAASGAGRPIRAVSPSMVAYIWGQESISVAQISMRQVAMEARRGALSAQAQLANDVRLVEAENKVREEVTKHVLAVASDASRLNLGNDAKTWRDWLVEQSGSPREATPLKPKPTISSMVALNYNPVAVVLPTIITGSALKAVES